MDRQFNIMRLYQEKGIWIEDISGTLLQTEGEAPQTTKIPTRRFVRRVNGMTKKAVEERWDINKYLEQVFRGKDKFPPHRYFMPYTNALKRKLRMDTWHVLEGQEIINADTGRAHPESINRLRSYFLDQHEAEDLSGIREKFNIVGGSGILYEDNLATLALMGQARELMSLAVFRDNSFLDTGLEVKYAVGRFFKAIYPGVPLIERDDCQLTALVMTGVADSVSLVSHRNQPHIPWDNLQALRDRLPDYLRVNPGRLHYGRLTNALIT